MHLLEHLVFGPSIILILTGAILLYRFKRPHNLRTAYRLSLCALLLLFLSSVPLFQAVIALPLAPWIPSDSAQNADAIVVLGGGTTPLGAPVEASADRAYTGSRLFLAGRAPLLVLTGNSRKHILGNAIAMRTLALGLGVPAARIRTVPGKNTYQESLNAKKILAPSGIHRILLVTSHYHIVRAAAVFRHQGFTVLPYPVPEPRHWWLKPPSWKAWEDFAALCHEYGGLLVYWLRGRIG